MIDCVKPIQNGIESAFNATGKVVQGAVSVTSTVFKDTGNLRAVTSGIVAFVDALDLNNVPVHAAATLVQTCKGFTKFVGGINVVQRTNELTSGEAFKNFVRLTSRIALIAYDILNCLEFLASMAIIAAGTASRFVVGIFGTTPQAIMPTLGFIGYGLELGDNFHTLFTDGFTWKTGFGIAKDATKLVGIALTGIAGYIPRMIQLSCIIGGGVLAFGQVLVINYLGCDNKPKGPNGGGSAPAPTPTPTPTPGSTPDPVNSVPVAAAVPVSA
jgi:hypothetical protein